MHRFAIRRTQHVGATEVGYIFFRADALVNEIECLAIVDLAYLQLFVVFLATVGFIPSILWQELNATTSNPAEH